MKTPEVRGLTKEESDELKYQAKMRAAAKKRARVEARLAERKAGRPGRMKITPQEQAAADKGVRERVAAMREKLRAQPEKAKPAAPANVDLLKELELESQEGVGEGPGGRPGSPEWRAAVKGKSEAGRKKMLAKDQGLRLEEAEAEGREPERWEVPGALKKKRQRAKGKRPSLPKNWRKLAYNHPDRVAFREWFSKGRKSKAVAKGKAKAPATKGVPRGKASEAADKRALETRIAMKIKNNEPIPASWKKKLKDLDTRLGVEKAGRRLRGTVLVGSEEEKRQKAKIKGATASTRELMKTISPQARARYAKGKKISEDIAGTKALKAEAAKGRQEAAARDARIEAAQKAEVSKGRQESLARIARVREGLKKRKEDARAKHAAGRAQHTARMGAKPRGEQ